MDPQLGPHGASEVLHEPHWPHVEQGLRDLSGLCRRAVESAPAVRSVCHYSGGILDFAVRPTGVGEPVEADHGAAEQEGVRGYQLVLLIADYDRVMRQLNTGELMRLVVGTGHGGMYCARVRWSQYLAAITEDADAVDALDEAMNTLVTRIRTTVYNLPDEQLGGEHGAQLPEVVGGNGLNVEIGPRYEADATVRERLSGLLCRFANPDDLHYAAYFQNWSLRMAVDAFDHTSLAAWFLTVTPDARRAGYRDLAGRITADARRLRGVLNSRDTIDRLVLDVQEGAVFVHWLGSDPGEFLLGVTLNQAAVDRAEHRLRGLSEALRRSAAGHASAV